MNLITPKISLRLEGLVVLATASVMYQETGFHWEKFFLLFLLPDLSMAGYFLGTRVGASAYNAAHTYVGPFLLWLISHFGHRPSLVPLVLIWAAHIGFDRLLGYGMKYPTGFKDTHLGRV